MQKEYYLVSEMMEDGSLHEWLESLAEVNQPMPDNKLLTMVRMFFDHGFLKNTVLL